MAKYSKREFVLGEWWIGKRAGSEAWYRCRFDAKTGQTVRFSLGTENLSEAKERLTNWWIENCRKPERPAGEVLLSEVLLSYFKQHAEKTASGRRIKSSLGHINAFFEGKTVSQAAREVDDFKAAMLAKGMKGTSVNNLLIIMKAAINRAWRRAEITSVPFIPLLDAKTTTPKGRALKPAEIAALLASASPHIHAMMMVMLGTGCRPQAAVELTWAQVDFDGGLIYLNPDGREQTKKFRPVVRLPPTLRAYLMTIRRPSGYVVKWGNSHLTRWEVGWRGARKRAGLDNQVNPYSFRHSVGRWLRSSGVSKWNTSEQLGHGGSSTTDVYAPHDPAYLFDACAAIEKLMQEVAACQLRRVA